MNVGFHDDINLAISAKTRFETRRPPKVGTTEYFNLGFGASSRRHTCKSIGCSQVQYAQYGKQMTVPGSRCFHAEMLSIELVGNLSMKKREMLFKMSISRKTKSRD